MGELSIDFIKTQMTRTLGFIAPLLPLANAHANYFIVDSHWDTFLPSVIQDHLLLLSDAELRNLPHLKHNSDPEPCGLSKEKNSQCQGSSQLVETSKCDYEKYSSESCDNDRVEWKYKSLHEFCQIASKCTVNSHGITTEGEELLRNFGSGKAEIFVKEFMNQKKGHEVDITSHVCSVLARDFNSQLVIDFGSGKGYLGQNLCLQYDLPVLGIDSAPINTQSAEKRLELLGKQWDGLTLNAKLSNEGEKKVSKKAKKKLKSTKDRDESKIEGNSSSKTVFNEATPVEMQPQSNEHNVYLENTHTSKNASRHSSAKASKYVSVTMFVDQRTDFMKLAYENFPDLFLSRSGETSESQEHIDLSSQSFVDCCATNKDQGSSEKLTENELLKRDSVPRSDSNNVTDIKCNDQDPKSSEHSVSASREACDLLLTGLHTCGDLASTTLHIFVNHSQIKAVCSVGCCYNLLSEQFTTNNELDDTKGNTTCGFPMSQFLQEKKFHLGDSARNLACQSVHRMSATDQPLQGERFFPRALLQALVQGVCKNEGVTWKGLRSLEKKCGSTEEYLRRACETLTISNLVSEDTIKDYVERYSDHKHRLAAFFQLRTLLAPCIESLILMDRVCYLLEQENVDKVYLVQLFDPVISPRCYGIVAVKK